MPSISSSPHSTGGGGSVSLITKLEDQAGLGHPVVRKLPEYAFPPSGVGVAVVPSNRKAGWRMNVNV